MTPLKKISVREIEYTAYELAKKFMEWDEPIPDFSTRFPHILETCLESLPLVLRSYLIKTTCMGAIVEEVGTGILTSLLQ